MNTILCIEDEPVLRSDIVEELEDAGYKLLEARDGSEGLQMILTHKPDLVVSDITMPNKNGNDLLNELRRDHPEFSDMPFIFLSALAGREEVLSGVQLGADDYLTKPIDFEMLQVKITASLRQRERMLKQKDEDQVRLFKAMNKIALPEEFEQSFPAMESRQIVMVGESSREMWAIQKIMEQVGHRVRVFTSGSSYLKKVKDGCVDADLTFLWCQSDDMQAPMIRQLSENRSGRYIMVIPEHLYAPGMKLSQPRFHDSIGLPIDDGELLERIADWMKPNSKLNARN